MIRNESLNAANELSLIDFFWETPVECFVFTSNDVHLWVAVTSPLDLPVYQTHVSPSPGDLPGHIPLFRLDNANRYFALDAHDGVLRVKSSLATHVDSKGTHCTNLNLLESNATKSDRPEWHLALFSRFREGQGGGIRCPGDQASCPSRQVQSAEICLGTQLDFDSRFSESG